MTGLWANRWWVVVASACGLMVGQGSILIFTFGVFLKPVSEGLGVSRGELSSALFVIAGGFLGWGAVQGASAVKSNYLATGPKN